MGRGKSKARSTKTAREIKYQKSNIDFENLETELHSSYGNKVGNLEEEPSISDQLTIKKENQ